MLSDRISNITLTHRHVITAGFGILISSYLAIYLVDIRNIFGLRSLFWDGTIPTLWHYLFKEWSIIEIFQWYFLGLFSVAGVYISRKLKDEGNREGSMFWLLFGLGSILILIEDITNLRHFLLRSGGVPATRIYVHEMTYFGIIASPFVLAILIYGKDISRMKTVRLLIVAGFIFYGTGVVVSGPITYMGLDENLGNVLYEAKVSLNEEELRCVYEESDRKIEDRGGGLTVRERLTDFLLEESIELMGIVMLLASSVSYNNNYTWTRGS